MSEDCDDRFDIEQWRRDFDADMAIIQGLIDARKRMDCEDVLTAEDQVMLMEMGISPEDDVCKA